MAPADLLRPLEGQREETLRIVEGLDDSALDRADNESGRSVRHILAHLAWSETAVTRIIREALDGELTHAGPADRESFTQGVIQGSEQWDIRRCVEQLKETHAGLRALFAGMSEEDLDAQVRWPEWPARTIRASIPYMLAHEDAHLDQVRRALGLD